MYDLFIEVVRCRDLLSKEELNCTPMLTSRLKVVTICSGVDSPFKAVAQAHPAMMDPEGAMKVIVATFLLPFSG